MRRSHQMETLRYWPFVRGIHRPPVYSPHKSHWRGYLMYSLICAWINVEVNNREAGDLTRHRDHYNITVMLRPSQIGRHFADDNFKSICLHDNLWISLKISLKFFLKVQNSNIPVLGQIMAWCRPGDKPLSGPMMASLLMHICVTWSLSVNIFRLRPKSAVLYNTFSNLTCSMKAEKFCF